MCLKIADSHWAQSTLILSLVVVAELKIAQLEYELRITAEPQEITSETLEWSDIINRETPDFGGVALDH